MSRFEQRKHSKPSIPIMPTPGGHMQYAPQPQPHSGLAVGSDIIGGNMSYMAIGAIGMSLAISIFLYRETRKMKVQLSDIAKSVQDNEQLTNNTTSIEDMETQLSQIKMLLQRMTRPPNAEQQMQMQAQMQAQAQAQAQREGAQEQKQVTSDPGVCDIDGNCEPKIEVFEGGPSLDEEEEVPRTKSKVLQI
jgi:hypothetical protein